MQFMHFSTIFAMLAVFGDLGDPVVPTLRGVSGDVVTVYAYSDTKGRFFAICSSTKGRTMPVPKKQNDCFHQSCPSEWAGTQPAFFTLGSPKIEVFETCFYDIVTTQYDHPRYAKHALGCNYVFFTLFRY